MIGASSRIRRQLGRCNPVICRRPSGHSRKLSSTSCRTYYFIVLFEIPINLTKTVPLILRGVS
ncbi:unnamed protein product [Tuber melanosporum]|uniref:(Perigord truffle) hypothetical protein n=1 Tax=Tuber melanosporum (strain Mel28) TaxID=656061 RepID=D5G7L0_TUBMM|nr:uncharacterized protein GSTUM_00004605001 [Tuber melanosporum]CAZ80503.1 unnamed protein product [Tuber melanosporum]